MHATSESAALDMAINEHLTLSSKIQCHKISTGVYGSLTLRTVGMVLEKYSLTSQGFIVYSQCIDKDFKKEI